MSQAFSQRPAPLRFNTGSEPRAESRSEVAAMGLDQTLQQFKESETGEAFSLQNPRLLKVELADVTIQAKRGAMVAYQGDVKFEHAGSGGMGRLLKKVATGENLRLMKVSGSGEVFLADHAQHVHLIRLDSESITVNTPN